MSVPFSSGRTNFINIAFRPKAIGFSSNEIDFAPSVSIKDWADFLIESRLDSGDLGIIFIINSTVAILEMENEGL